MPFDLPFTDPVLIVALAMALFLFAPLLVERYQVPGIIGVILAGAVVGPHGLGLLERDPTIVLLGTVGLLYLVFQAGLELDLHRFAEYRRRSIIFGLLSFGIPMLLAVAVMPLLGFGWAAAILMGSIIGSHTLLAYPIVSRLGLVKNTAVITVVGGTLVTDTLALGVLAVVAGSLEGGMGVGFLLRLFGLLALYVAVVLWAVPRVGRWFFRNTPGQAPAEFVFLMVVLFASAYLANLAGAQPIIGAFLAGLTLNRLIPNQGPLMVRVRFVGNALFIPFFLLSVGMLVDARVLAGSLEVWIIAAAIIAMVHLGKFAGAWISQRIFGYSREEGTLMFGLSLPQAAATLAVTFVGLEIGLFEGIVVNAVIVMILVTGLVGPSLVERFGRQIALTEETKPYEPTDAPQRILIPIANPATAEALLDLAFAIRGPLSDEPLYPLMVVRDNGGDASASVAEAERMLGHAVLYAAAAAVPVVPLTRVDANVATGIARGVAETRTSVVVVGWDGRSSPGYGIFGSVLDQALEQIRQMVLVAKLGHPLNTTRRVVLVFPPAIDHHPGLYGALQTAKRLASEQAAPIVGLVVGDTLDRYRELYERVKPQVPASFEAVSGWGALLSLLQEKLQPDDLVVVLSSRRGTLAWDRALERLPGQLARLVPESFIMIYPSREQPVVLTDFADTVLPRALRPERVVFDLPPMPFEQALAELLETAFGNDPMRLHSVAATLTAGEREFSSEITPGVVVPHALVSGLDEAMMFLAISPEGIAYPGAIEPAHLIFLLLSPVDRPQEHLRNLAEIARLVSKPERMQGLLESSSVEDLLESFRAPRAVPVVR